MTRKFRTAAAVAAAGALIAPAMALPAVAAATTLIGSGSSAEQPVLEHLFAQYESSHRNISFVYTADGGNAGIKDVQSGHSQFAVNTRAPLPSDSGTLQYKLFLDGLCVAVNPANHLSSVRLGTIANIFLGTLTDWGSVSASALTGTIDPIGRNSSAGSYTFFQQAALKGQTQSSAVQQLSSDGLVANAVKRDRNAIGYVGLADAQPSSGVKRLRINGAGCSQGPIKSGRYPLSRFIWGVLPAGNPSRDVEAFFDWVRTSHSAGRIIARTAVPAFNKGY